MTDKKNLETAFEAGRLYASDELELNTEGYYTAFEAWYDTLKRKTHKVLDMVYHEDENNDAFVGTIFECGEWVSKQGFGYKIVPMTKEEIEFENKDQ